MMRVPYVCDPEIDFINVMIPHHQAAVDMCAILDAAAPDDAYLVSLCENITRNQKAEIRWMQGWLANKGEPLVTTCSGEPTPQAGLRISGLKF